MAMMVPLSYGIAVRITELAPGHEEVLGYVTGSAQLVYLVLSPMIGIWSDRTRSRFGPPHAVHLPRHRHRPRRGSWSSASPRTCSSSAPAGSSAWSAGRRRAAAIQTLQADKLPEEQRGKVSALTGLMTQIAPVIGIGIAYAVSSSTLLVFLVPGIIGAVLLVLFPLFKPEGSSKDLPVDSSVTLKKRRHQLRLQRPQVPRLRVELARPLRLLHRPVLQHHVRHVLLRPATRPARCARSPASSPRSACSACSPRPRSARSPAASSPTSSSVVACSS